MCIWKVSSETEANIFRPRTLKDALLLAKCAAKDMLRISPSLASSCGIDGRLILHGGIGSGKLQYFDLPYGRFCLCAAVCVNS